jgi:hypothetical protein
VRHVVAASRVRRVCRGRPVGRRRVIAEQVVGQEPGANV